MCARPKRAPFAQSTTARVLSLLREGGGAFVSGEAICRRLGLSRVAVWKHIHTLADQGCRIEARRHVGYRLTSPPDLPTEEAVAPLLGARRLGRPLLFFREADSTNRQAASRAAAGAPEGLVIVADYQSAGRGRMGRGWYSPKGANLYFSIVLRPDVGVAHVPSLPLVAGCAVARTLARLAPDLPVRVKWPNDLLVDNRKLGGILCEMAAEADRVEHVVVGIGLNVNLRRGRLPRALAATATSLALATGRTWPRADVLAALLREFEEAYDLWCAEGLEPFLPELAARDALKGRPVRIQQSAGRVVEGIAAGIQSDGSLLVRQDAGTEVLVYSGDAHLLPPEKEAGGAPGAPPAKKNPALP